jgi:hypothetical protein
VNKQNALDGRDGVQALAEEPDQRAPVGEELDGALTFRDGGQGAAFLEDGHVASSTILISSFISP